MQPFLNFLLLTLLFSPSLRAQKESGSPVDETPTRANSTDGLYISWREHIIDSPITSRVPFNGSDGLVIEDLDRDGFIDIVSVHESDATYDSAEHDPDFEESSLGHVRISFGSFDPKIWTSVTLAEGEIVSSPEDAAIRDLNGDGFLDILVAAENGHVVFFQNPGKDIRTRTWPSRIIPMTQGRGSFLRVFAADFNGDGKPEIVSPNKGAQRPGPSDFSKSNPVSIFSISGNPLQSESWRETILGKYSIPQNSEPVDLDGDGDLDIIIGSRGEQRIAWFENISKEKLEFKEHAIGIVGTLVSGFNMEYLDVNKDGRLDIIAASNQGLVWIEQPSEIDSAWIPHLIGSFSPDSITGLELADINQDGLIDIMAGSYSRGSRLNEANASINDPLGRIGWFENKGLDKEWIRHDISRRKRGMFDTFIAQDIDGDGDTDFIGTRGNSAELDGVFWLEQVRSREPLRAFTPARQNDSRAMALP